MNIISHKPEEIDSLRSTAMIIFVCDGCGRECSKTKTAIDQSIKYRKQDKLFCNQSCFNDFKFKHSGINCNCTECGKEIRKTICDFKKIKNPFCSRKCAAIFNNRKRGEHSSEHKNHISIGLKKHYLNHKNHNYGKKCPQNSHPGPRQLKRRNIRCQLNCVQCNKIIFKTKNDLLRNKTNKCFCSKSCRMKHYNINHPKIKSYNKSYAEQFLFDLIKNDFPNLEGLQNNRKILSDGLELDLFIPYYNLAIELNGPVHYLPIYGEDRLKKAQNKDILKQLEIQLLKINLLIIDISMIKSKKQTAIFLTKYYLEYIKPLF